MTKPGTGYRYPTPIDGYDTVDVCFKIPNQQLYLAAAYGAVTSLLQWWNWNNDDNPTEEERQEVAQYLRDIILPSYGYGEDCMTSLRLWQNPLNPCLLMVSYDGGETEQVAFNYALCQVPTTTGSTSDLFLSDSVYQSYEGTWIAQGLAGLAPELEDGTANVPDRDAALCYTAAQWVDQVCELELERRNQEAEGTFTIYGVITAVGAAALAVTGVGWLAIAGFGIFAALVGVGITVLSSLAKSVLENQAARNEVACCLYDNMEGLEPDKTNLEAALDSCTPPLTGDSETLRDALNQILDTDEGQTSFVALTKENYRIAQLDTLPGCPCDTWAHDFLDGDNDALEWTILPYDNPSSNQCEAVYNAGADRFDGCDAGANFSHAVLIEAMIPQTIITKVQFTGSGIGTRVSTADGQFVYLDGQEVEHDDYGLSWTDEVTEWNGQQTVAKIVLRCAAALGQATAGADSRITQIRIEGRGDNPFI